MKLTNKFIDSLKDYLFFLDRAYPQKSILKLIGDRYELSSTERSVLYRGVCSTHHLLKRKSKQIELIEHRNCSLYIDAYNVLITIGSYLNGKIVFIANDGYLRDASELHGKQFRKEIMNRSIVLLFQYLNNKSPAEVIFYIDQPVSYSGKLADDLRKQLLKNQIQGDAVTLQSPDHIMKKLSKGILATSDSAIIENTNLQILDLPKHVLDFHFSPTYLNLSEILS